MKKFPIIALSVILASCSYFKKRQTAGADVIARVNDQYLYASDIQPLTKGLTGDDSIKVLKSYAESWVRKKLLLEKAIENIPEDDIGITKKIEDYREALLLYEYEKALINQKLDTVIKEEEMLQWHDKMKNDFLLESDVYLVSFIKLKKDAPELNNARKWILKPKSQEDSLKAEGYCREFAVSYTKGEGMWYEKANILKNFPLNEYDINSLSGTKSLREFKTDEGFWFIRISNFIRKGEPSPLEFIREQIMKRIIEKRRLLLVEKAYDRIYQDGIQDKSFEVLVK